MNLFSHFLHTMKKAWSISACVSLLIGGPFLCANVHAANAPTSVMRPPQVSPLSQQQVITTPLPLQRGTLNTKNQCDRTGQGNIAMSTFTQNISNSYQNYSLAYLWWWGGFIPVYSYQNETSVVRPAMYDIGCEQYTQGGWSPYNPANDSVKIPPKYTPPPT